MILQDTQTYQLKYFILLKGDLIFLKCYEIGL